METTDKRQLNSLTQQFIFHENINKAMTQAARHKRMLAFLLIDIDAFQALKTKLGQEKIGLLLTEIEDRFSHLIRTSDSLTKLDTNDFAILLTDLDHPKLIGLVAEKILQACAQPFTIDKDAIHLSCSIGIAVFPEDGETLEDLQNKATAALYQAKHQGGNHYQFALPQRTLEARDFTQLQSALRQAIDKNEFTLYYQPKLDLKTRRIMGVEALLRWEHPSLGLLDPLQFVPSAEETGLMMKIGEWALREACRANKRWQQEAYHPISVAVNLSPKQFHHPQIIEKVKNILKETGLRPEYLELEITEMTVMDNTEKVRPLLQGLRDLGLSLSIDDFGTGHTSLSYLKDYPINTVKIDQSFIKPLPLDSKTAAITKAVITLAHQFDCKVVAEGVETLEQLQFLAEQDCDIVQGHFISRPLPEGKLKGQLEKLAS